VEVKTENISGLAQYQSGSIVSREILKKETGTVTVFAFDAGQGLSEHTAPFDALACILDGNALITIAGKEYALSKGEMIIMPGGKPHSLKAKGKFKMMLVMLKT
jgi:quercetin dioxygenase-like cupin family protein